MNIRTLATEFACQPNDIREFAPDDTRGLDDVEELSPEAERTIREAWDWTAEDQKLVTAVNRGIAGGTVTRHCRADRSHGEYRGPTCPRC